MRIDSWTEYETQYLIENYKKHSSNYIAEHLNRTPIAVVKRANKLGITKQEKWNKERVISELLELKEKYGNVTFTLIRKIKKQGLYNATIRYFGSWNNAKIELGLGKIRNRFNKLPKSAYDFTPELGYVVGVVIGDGTIHRRTIKLKTIDYDFIEAFRYNIEKWSGIKTKERIVTIEETLRHLKNSKESVVKTLRHPKNMYDIRLYSQEASMFLKSLIDNILNNKIDIDSLPKEFKIMFIKGLFDSEGSVGYNKNKYGRIYPKVIFCNKDVRLVKLVENILHSFGFHTTKYVSKYNEWFITIAKVKEVLKFYNMIGFSIKRKQDKLKKLIKLYKSYGGG